LPPFTRALCHVVVVVVVVMGSMCLFFLLVVLMVYLAPAAASPDASDSEFFEKVLWRACLERAEPQFKDREVAENFCEFVPHVARQHGADLAEIAVIREKFTLEVIQNAMDDLVRWRKQVYEEDVHVLGLKYMGLVRKWALYEENQRDEL
jgi:hypothetical protein